ncbi:tripartite tricarboxylate transporter substrate binding protein [Candidimonas humi]|uniref:Bug family tripartite tricarboxylate transporter substrate binding protein n=1 Tax=Candidimonas humi TaxID=683355 RepID=A0ABV8P5T1_9BURK|nr:tripartite tricarboxylate transporter substrate binding protein [Candidimonas humi]MBV6307167.1 tripartite tricarboxylate transporter substrate binding protein [Candidimonas humi]
MIVPSTSGGLQDVLARKIGEGLTRRLGQPVIVENHAGANGAIGTNLIAKAVPDGYTIGMATPGTLSTDTLLQPNLPYDPARDIQPLTLAIRTPVVLVVNAKFPAKSVKDFVAYAKAHPNTVTVANGGLGSSQFVSARLFEKLAGVKLVEVAYQGGAAAMPDLVSGRVSAYLNSPLDIMPFIRSGQLRALAVGSPERLAALPHVPTLREEGIEGFDFSAWYGLVAPKGIPAPVLKTLNENIVAIMKSPDVRAMMAKMDYEIVADTPEQFRDEIKKEVAIDSSVLQKAAAHR